MVAGATSSSRRWPLTSRASVSGRRACTPAPGAWSTQVVDGETQRIKIGPVTIADDRERLAPGELEVTKNAVFVGTATAPVRLGDVKAFGKKQMPAADWARGVRLESGTRFGA